MSKISDGESLERYKDKTMKTNFYKKQHASIKF